MAELEDVFQKVGAEEKPAETAGDKPAEKTVEQPAEETTVGKAPDTTVAETTKTKDIKPEDTKTETKPAETKAETKSTVATPEDRLSWLQEKLGIKVDSEDQLSSYADRLRGYDDLEKRVNEVGDLQTKYDELIAKNKELEDEIDPLKWFANEKEFKAQQLKMKYPDRNPYILQEIVDKDLNKMSDIDVLVKKAMIDTPDMIDGEAGAKEAVLADYLPEDVELSDADSKTLNRIKMAANSARRELRELTNIETPKLMTREERIAAREEKIETIRNGWKPTIEKLSVPESLEIKDEQGNKLFDFKLDEESLSGVAEFLDAFVVAGEIQPTEENLSVLIEQRDRNLINDNLPKILTIYKNQLMSEFQKAEDERNNNTKPPNTTTRPPAEGKIEANGFERLAAEARGKVTERQTIG